MRRSLPSLLFVLFFLLACGTSDEEKIRQVLNRRGEALSTKDLSLYISCVSNSYQDKGEDLDRLRDRIGGYFQTFDRIAYGCSDRSVQIEGEGATAIQQFHMEVEQGGRKRSHSGKEILFLKKEAGEWKIVKGL
jgi:ketosteroid isomerase-like protein